MTPEEVEKLIQEENIEIVDLKFNDLPGLWQHFSMPVAEVAAAHSIWGEGVGFDGSSIRGFQKIQESDMILMLDPDTAMVDPMMKHPTVSIICDIYDPLTRELLRLVAEDELATLRWVHDAFLARQPQ